MTALPVAERARVGVRWLFAWVAVVRDDGRRFIATDGHWSTGQRRWGMTRVVLLARL